LPSATGAGGPPAAGRPGCDYVVSFASGKLTRAEVRATLPVALGKLEIDSYGAWSQPAGWATFIRDLEARDANGAPLVVTKSGRLTWQIAENHSGAVTLSYGVDMSYAEAETWPEGPRSTAAFSDGAAIMIPVTSLLLFPTNPAGATVRFELPEGESWRVSTPWAPHAGDAYTFRADSVQELTGNLIVVGRHTPRVVDVDGFETTLVMLGDRAHATDLLAPAIRNIVAYYRDLLRDPRRERYLMVWFRDGNWETGEAYRSSFVVIGPDVPTPQNAVVWTDSIAHELFHRWNGHAMASADEPGTQWFMEGFTEYIANLAALRTGSIERPDFFRLMDRHLLMYLMYRYNGPWERVSLVDAGAKKSQNNAPIYDGGWLAAFCTDVLIREATANRAGIDDMIRLMFERFGRQGQQYTVQDIIQAASDTAGADLAGFFNDHVRGRRVIPIRDFLRRAGCDAVVSLHVVIVRGADSPSSIMESILTGKKP
jgi:predicted metalloprotease with PDZ domain